MALVSSFEAECLVSKLRRIPIEEMGGSNWLSQHEVIERLNLQCHESARSKHDEYVVDELLTQNKLPTVIYNLVTTEVWKEKVFPLIVDRIDDALSLRTYFILFEEATLVTMLQILLFHPSSMAEGASSDDGDAALLELTDYVHRKLLSVAAGNVDAKHFNGHLTEDDAAEKLKKQRQHFEYTICSGCVSIARFLSEHLSRASISVLERVVNTHEMVLVLITLIEASPWTVRKEKGIEKFNGNNRFVAVDGNNRFRLTKLEGELWLAVYNLLLDESCAAKFELTEQRRAHILRLRPLLLPQIVDQLPILKGLQRMLAEIGILSLNRSNGPYGAAAKDRTLKFIEIVPEFRENLLSSDFEAIAKAQLSSTFDRGEDDDRKRDLEVLGRIYNNFEGLEDLLLDTPICAECGHDAEKRCSRCKSEWYCSRECQLRSWRKHRSFCQAISKKRDEARSGDDPTPSIRELTTRAIHSQ